MPARGLIRFHTSGYEDVRRVRFRLQYALAPRRIVTWNGPEFVIEYGPKRTAKSLVHDPRFVLTAAPGNDMRVYRRIQP